MNTVQYWISENYDNIVRWAKNASYNHEAATDLAHDIIEAFTAHPLAEELVAKDQARYFVTRMLLNQARSTTSPFNRNYRKKIDYTPELVEEETETYDLEIDFKLETIEGICEDLKLDSIEGYYCITIFEQIVRQPKMNFSKLAKETNIPRTSISKAYYRAIEMIKHRIQDYGISI